MSGEDRLICLASQFKYPGLSAFQERETQFKLYITQREIVWKAKAHRTWRKLYGQWSALSSLRIWVGLECPQHKVVSSHLWLIIPIVVIAMANSKQLSDPVFSISKLSLAWDMCSSLDQLWPPGEEVALVDHWVAGRGGAHSCVWVGRTVMGSAHRNREQCYPKRENVCCLCEIRCLLYISMSSTQESDCRWQMLNKIVILMM